jgi:hypothetical protein
VEVRGLLHDWHGDPVDSCWCCTSIWQHTSKNMCFSGGSMLQTWVTSYALRSLQGPCAGRLSHDTAMMQCVTRWHGLQQERRAILSMIQLSGLAPRWKRRQILWRPNWVRPADPCRSAQTLQRDKVGQGEARVAVGLKNEHIMARVHT